jgi:FkbM family methyltransferase
MTRMWIHIKPYARPAFGWMKLYRLLSRLWIYIKWYARQALKFHTLKNHHPILEEFERSVPFDDELFHHNFMGACIPHTFDGRLTNKIAVSGRSILLSRDPTYPYENSEDYFEWIDLLTAVTRANSKFTMIEVGAGYGRWIANAGAAIRRRKNAQPLQQRFIAVEANSARFNMMVENCKCNEIESINLIHAACTRDGEAVFMSREELNYGNRVIKDEQLLQRINPAQQIEMKDDQGNSHLMERVPAIRLSTIIHEPVDFLDMDIQGAELEVVEEGIESMTRFVKLVHIGTHDATIERGLREIFLRRGWHPRYDFPAWKLSETPYGPVKFMDGIQSWER